MIPFLDEEELKQLAQKVAESPDGNYQGVTYSNLLPFLDEDDVDMVFPTAIGKLGVAICWDQWFPETARILALKGAEVLVYPTAIGSEPVLPKDSKDHWRNVMKGHVQRLPEFS